MARVHAGGLVGEVPHGLHPDPSVAATQKVLGLIDRDRHQPRTQAFGIADLVELPPGDEPRGLHGLLGDEGVVTDGQADPPHILVVCGDDATKGGLVAASRRRDQLVLMSICEP